MPNEPWHLSKSVPITFILAILAQTVALIWFVATLRNDVDNNRTDIVKVETRLDRVERSVQDQALTLARIDENLKSIKSILETMAKERRQ